MGEGGCTAGGKACWSWTRRTFVRLVGIDYRSLALLRVGLALLLIYDVYVRLTEYDAFLSNTGVYPCEDAMRDKEGRHPILQPSIHNLFCYSDLAQVLLLLIEGIAAVLMLVGYKTFYACLACWFFVVSIQNRNDKILHGGDTLYRLALFWILFLPMGHTFSIDSALCGKKPARPRLSFAEDTSSERNYKVFVSLCCLGIMLQGCHIYFWSAMLKEFGQTWKEGSALYYALHLDGFASPFAVWLRANVPYGLLKFLSDATLYLEKFGPILFWTPFCTEIIRMLLLGSFIGLHVGIALTLRVEAFSVITPTCLTAFIPSCFWDRLFAFLGRWKRFIIVKIYYKKLHQQQKHEKPLKGSNNSDFEADLAEISKGKANDSRCGFVEGLLRIGREFLLMPQSKLFGVDEFDVEAPSLQFIEDEENRKSAVIDNEDWLWMVVDEDGNKHVGFEAVIAFCKASVLLFWLAPILRLSCLYRLNSAIYNKLANVICKYIINRQQQSNQQKSPNNNTRKNNNTNNSYNTNMKLLSNSNSVASKLVDRKIYNRIKRRRIAIVKNCVCAFFIVYVIALNAGSVYPNMRPPHWMNGLGYTLKLFQQWKMFADVPQTDDWFVFRGELQNGKVVDAFSGEAKEPPVTKMADMAYIYPSVRWQKFISKLARGQVARAPLFNYMCTRWNDAHPNKEEKMATIDSYHLVENSPKPGQHQLPFTSYRLPIFDCAARSFRNKLE